MNEWLVVFLLAAVLVSIIGLVFTYRAGLKQTETNHEHTEAGEAVVKHKITRNPIFWTYVLFGFGVAVGGVLFYYFYYTGG